MGDASSAFVNALSVPHPTSPQGTWDWAELVVPHASAGAGPMPQWRHESIVQIGQTARLDENGPTVRTGFLRLSGVFTTKWLPSQHLRTRSRKEPAPRASRTPLCSCRTTPSSANHSRRTRRPVPTALPRPCASWSRTVAGQPRTSTLDYTVAHGGSPHPVGKQHVYSTTIDHDTTFQLSYVTGETTQSLTTTVAVTNPKPTGLEVDGDVRVTVAIGDHGLTVGGNLTVSGHPPRRPQSSRPR